jgi:steroid Delta-isomerase
MALEGKDDRLCQLRQPPTEVLRKALDAHIAALSAIDPQRIAASYADDGQIEDPVGTGVHRGRATVEAYFSRGLGSLASHVEIQVLTALPSGDSIAAHWTMKAHGKAGREVEAEGIDVLQMDAHGKIIRSEGYWNAAAFRQALAGS